MNIFNCAAAVKVGIPKISNVSEQNIAQTITERIIVSVGVSSVNSTRAGLCPHGLPPGACPICSGGMSTQPKTADFSAKPGEMSWNECAAIGAFLKSLKNARMAKESDYQQHLINMAKFEANMAKSAEKLTQFIQAMNQNVLTKPIAFVAQRLVLPVVNTLKNMPSAVLNTLANISGRLADISDKLAAVYGELKAAVNKKVSDFTKRIKKKLFSIFTLFEADNESDENEVMVAFEKQLDKLKNLLEKISKEPTEETIENEY